MDNMQKKLETNMNPKNEEGEEKNIFVNLNKNLDYKSKMAAHTPL